MSSASPSQGRQSSTQEPKIQHSFDGDAKILNGTFEGRAEVRKALSTLQQALQKLEGRNCQVAADIKLRIGGPEPKEHTYTVAVYDSKLDLDTFLRQFPAASKSPLKAPSASTPASGHVNGQGTSLGRRESRAADDDDDDVVEVRPTKKARTESGDASFEPLRNKDPNDTLDFVKKWHAEWVKQGGWLFDTLNKAEKLSKDGQAASVTRLQAVQDVLGQSMNAASAATMAELANISKLIPWLEHCRKTGADKTQAREEKWRTSSATFHDNARRDRETAEKRLEDQLNKQRALLIKIAEANGVDVDDEEKESDRETREASLGAQLTAELNMEISRAGEDGKERAKPRETINIDDDDDK